MTVQRFQPARQINCMDVVLEVIAFTHESARIAQRSGAHRIELCDNPGEGGTTPGYGMIKKVREDVAIQLYPIVRPRGGDFLYSPAEYEIMKRDIEMARELLCDGVVIGILTPEGEVDKERMKWLVELAYPMGVTFHRAFDRVKDPFQALEDLIELGCERILTSGRKPTAIEGAFLLKQLIEQANDRIVVMPGSGVRSDNILELAKQTGAIEFHSSARAEKPSAMQYVNPDMQENLKETILNEAEVSKILQLLKEYHPLA